MSDGLMIETPVLTREDAALAVMMLQTVQIRMGDAERGLRVMGSLARIANGVDVVRSVNPTSGSGK